MLDLPKDPAALKKLIDLANRRVTASSHYIEPDQKDWVRMFKIYHKIRDVVLDDDEPDIFLSYAFGIVEDTVSKITEPILQRKPPVRVQSKRTDNRKQADVLASFARQYYNRSEYQTEFTEANKEMAICGNNWEFDEYAQRWATGRRWQKVQKPGIMDRVKGLAGKFLPIQMPYQYEGIEEVEADYPARVGFNSYFPSIFDVFPEPNVKKVKDMHWIIIQERSVALDDLRKEFYVDPSTGGKTPLHDLTQLDDHYGAGREPGTVMPIDVGQIFSSHDYGRELRDSIESREDSADETVSDMDKVHLLRVMERDRIYTIVNGMFVTSLVKHPYHLPWIPGRLRVYTPINHKFFGWGVLRPIEEEIYELNDIHNLSMANWIRIINKMVAYDPAKIVSEDDFRPRAGGKIRIINSQSVANAIFPIDQADVTGSMLPMESNSKGLMERTTAIADFSPGTEGTKQTHKTLGGLLEIKNQLAVRFSTVTRLMLSHFQDQVFNMEVMLSQFQFDKVSLPYYGPNGEMTTMEANREDIDTGGVGFDYIIEEDPSFGDDAIARNQVMVMLQQSTLYTDKQMAWLQAGMNPEYLPDVDYSVVMGKMAESFKYPENALIKPHLNIMRPEQEFESIMQGQPVQPNPESNLLLSYAWHSRKAVSPEYQTLLEKGQIAPEADLAYKSFIEALQAMIIQIMQGSQQFAIQNQGVPVNA